jgi:outer membrane biogenesis lipoprotein LolB
VGAMLRSKRGGILVVLAVVALLAAPGAADAKKKHKKKVPAWKSTATLSLDPSATVFSGKVGSKFKACRAARLVNLTYFDPDGVNTAALAVERTNKKGKYTIDVPTPAFQGRYQLSVEAQKIRAKGKKQKCKAAQSAIVTL